MPFFVEFVVQSIIFVLFNFIVVCMVYPHFSVGLFCILGKYIKQFLTRSQNEMSLKFLLIKHVYNNHSGHDIS